MAIHQNLLERDGGAPGYLNLGALDSALYRAKWGPFFGPPQLTDRAALLLRGICQDHPFVDGNKRTAYEAADTFLAFNDRPLLAEAHDIIGFMLAVAQDLVDVAGMVTWLETHAKTINQEE